MTLIYQHFPLNTKSKCQILINSDELFNNLFENRIENYLTNLNL